MKKVVGSFQKLTLTLERTRSQASRMPGRVMDSIKNFQLFEKQRSTTHDMLRSELTALCAVQEEFRKTTVLEQEKNTRATLVYQEAIQTSEGILSSALEEAQSETITLAASLRQNLNSQSAEFHQLDEIDVQSDYQRQEHLHKIQMVYEDSTQLSGTASGNLKDGVRSMGIELDIEQQISDQENAHLAHELNQKAIRYLNEGKPGAAAEELEHAVRLAPNVAILWFNLARALTAVLEVEKAEKALQHATELLPDDPQIEQVSGWIALRKGEYRRSVDHFLLALQQDLSLAEEMDLLEGCAEAAYQAGMPELAEFAWQQVMKMDPYHPIAPIALEWMR